MEIARESIFISSLRSFCKTFFGFLGILIALFLFSILYGSFSSSPLVEEKTTLQLLTDANGKRDLSASSAPAILEIPIHGFIGDPQHVHSESFNDILTDSRTGLLSHDRVKGILLNFNTPGGTVLDSDNIYRMLKAYKEKYHVPIFAYVDGLCASGGMYIASAADQIFASPSSVVGSIGVILGPFMNVYELMQKIGIQALTLSQGIDKDMMNPMRPWKPGEDVSLQAINVFMYHHFIDVVTAARQRLDKTKLVNEYGAQVFDCVQGEKLGYVDHAMASRNDALLALLQEAKIDPEKSYQVVSLTPKFDWFSSLISGKSPLFSGKFTLDFGTLSIKTQPCYLYQP